MRLWEANMTCIASLMFGAAGVCFDLGRDESNCNAELWFYTGAPEKTHFWPPTLLDLQETFYNFITDNRQFLDKKGNKLKVVCDLATIFEMEKDTHDASLGHEPAGTLNGTFPGIPCQCVSRLPVV
jgi:hypothetical protein